MSFYKKKTLQGQYLGVLREFQKPSVRGYCGHLKTSIYKVSEKPITYIAGLGQNLKFSVSKDTTFSAYLIFMRHLVFPEMSDNKKCACTVQITYNLFYRCPEKCPKFQDSSWKCFREFAQS